MTKIAQDGVAKRRRHWIALCPPLLRPGNVNRLCHPLQIIQSKPLNFPAAQTVVNQQQQNRVVADADRVIL